MSEAQAPLPELLRPPGLVQLCRDSAVDRLEVFGSALTPLFRPGHSDVDLIVHFGHSDGPASMGQRFIALAEGLETLFGTRVDLMTDHPIANPYLREAINASRRVVYERAAAEAPV